jgi:hypothetical protein
MRQINVLASVLGIFASLMVAADGSAAPPGPGGTSLPVTPVAPAPAMGVATLSQLRVISVTRAPDVGGVFQVDVAVLNTTSSVAKRVGVGLRATGIPVGNTQQMLDLPGKAVKHFIFADPGGGPAVCGGTRSYEVLLSDMVATPTFRKVTAKTSACSFTTKVETPWNLITPDHAENNKKGTLYVNSATVETTPTCSTPLKVKAVVVNHTTKPAQGLVLALKEGADTNGSSASFSTPVNGSDTPVVSASAKAVKASTSVTLIDSQNSVGGKLSHSGISVAVTPSCKYDFDIDGPEYVEPAPSIPR